MGRKHPPVMETGGGLSPEFAKASLILVLLLIFSVFVYSDGQLLHHHLSLPKGHPQALLTPLQVSLL